EDQSDPLLPGGREDTCSRRVYVSAREGPIVGENGGPIVLARLMGRHDVSQGLTVVDDVVPTEREASAAWTVAQSQVGDHPRPVNELTGYFRGCGGDEVRSKESRQGENDGLRPDSDDVAGG